MSIRIQEMMKEIKLEDKLPMDGVKSKIWRMFDILRSEKISSDEYSVILFLLSAYKDNVITVDLLNENHLLKQRLMERLRKLEILDHYAPILDSFMPSLQRLSIFGIRDILDVLAGVDMQVLIEYFPDIFDATLYKISQLQGRRGGESIQPIEISRLMFELAELKSDAIVYNPFAGIASFGVLLHDNQVYFGQESVKTTWAIGALRLLAHQGFDKSSFTCEDSIDNWPIRKAHFDLIISNPPLRMRLGKQYSHIEHSEGFVEEFLIKKGLDSLKEKGKLITLLPHSFLNSSGREQLLREQLVNEDLIDCIISLPSGILKNTGISLVIMVLSKNKKMPGKVRFIDATTFVESTNQKDIILNDAGLLNYIKERNEHITQSDDLHFGIVNEPHENYGYNNHIERLVKVEDLKEFNFNLNVAKYFQKEIETQGNEQLVKLADLLTPIRGQRNELPNTGKLLKINNLKEDPFDYKLDLSEIEEIVLNQAEVQMISQSALLLTLRLKSLKPTFFDFSNTPIFINSYLRAFTINENWVDKAYLIHELHADYIQEQLEPYRSGSYMPVLKLEDLLNVNIKIVPLEEQRKKVEDVFHKALFKEKDKIAFIRNVFNEELGAKQHNIRQHLKNVKDSLDTLMDLMKKNGGVLHAEDVINPNRNVTVGFRFDRMYASLENVILEINSLTNEQAFSKPESIDMLRVIKDSLDEIAHPNFEVVSTKDEVSILGSELENLMISFSKKDLKELLNNVVENAVRHGFTDKDKFYKIIVDIRIDDDMVILTIKNNGNPFPRNISNQLGVKGKKAGKNANQGIGAWKIIQSIKHFGQDYEIIDEPENEFPVGWVFKFKLITE